MSHNLALHDEVGTPPIELEESAVASDTEQAAAQNKNFHGREALHFGYIPPYRAAYMNRNSGLIEC